MIDTVNNQTETDMTQTTLDPKTTAQIENEIGHSIINTRKDSYMIQFDTVTGTGSLQPWFALAISTGKAKKNSCRMANY